MSATDSAAAVMQARERSGARQWSLPAATCLLAALLSAGTAPYASAQTAERRHYAHLAVVIDMTVTPLVPGAPTSITLDRVLHANMYSSVALRHGEERILDTIHLDDGLAQPWRTGAAAGTARTSADSSDFFGTRVNLSTEITGDGWPYNQASSSWDSRIVWNLSGNSALTFTVHVSGDGTALQGAEFGNYGYRFVFTTGDGTERISGEWPGAPQEESFTFTVTNDGPGTKSGEWWMTLGTLVSVVSVVPEPTSVAMYLAGFGLLAATGYRQRKRRAPLS